MAEDTPPAETRTILAAALETVDPSNCKQHIEQRMLDLLNLFEMFPEAEIDPELWVRLLGFAVVIEAESTEANEPDVTAELVPPPPVDKTTSEPAPPAPGAEQ